MDINLPGISGIEAMKVLAEDPSPVHIPVIAISANAIPRDIEKGLEASSSAISPNQIKVTEFMETLMTLALKFYANNRVKQRGNKMMLNPSDILDASILIVDQSSNPVIVLLEQLLSKAGYLRDLDHESGGGLRAAPEKPLRPDPA